MARDVVRIGPKGKATETRATYTYVSRVVLALGPRGGLGKYLVRA